jgi:hypothetical protein
VTVHNSIDADLYINGELIGRISNLLVTKDTIEHQTMGGGVAHVNTTISRIDVELRGAEVDRVTAEVGGEYITVDKHIEVPDESEELGYRRIRIRQLPSY